MYRLALSNGPIGIAKQSVSASQTVRFATSNGMFCHPSEQQSVTEPILTLFGFEISLQLLLLLHHLFRLVPSAQFIH